MSGPSFSLLCYFPPPPSPSLPPPFPFSSLSLTWSFLLRHSYPMKPRLALNLQPFSCLSSLSAAGITAMKHHPHLSHLERDSDKNSPGQDSKSSGKSCQCSQLPRVQKPWKEFNPQTRGFWVGRASSWNQRWLEPCGRGWCRPRVVLARHRTENLCQVRSCGWSLGYLWILSSVTVTWTSTWSPERWLGDKAWTTCLSPPPV